MFVCVCVCLLCCVVLCLILCLRWYGLRAVFVVRVVWCCCVVVYSVVACVFMLLSVVDVVVAYRIGCVGVCCFV